MTTFTCPRCKLVSHNPHDVVYRYCGACHQFVSTWENAGAPAQYRWGACMGDFDIGSIVGTGPTPEAAVEELSDLLDEPDTSDIPEVGEDWFKRARLRRPR
jgi:hypothetical protein